MSVTSDVHPDSTLDVSDFRLEPIEPNPSYVSPVDFFCVSVCVCRFVPAAGSDDSDSEHAEPELTL